MIKIKRIYEDYSKSDGYRILIDRFWPRGISKDRAKVDLWIKEIAPSNGLRKWYSNNSENTKEFQEKYLKELMNNADSLHEIKKLIQNQQIITLLYSSKNSNPSHGIVLKEALKD